MIILLILGGLFLRLLLPLEAVFSFDQEEIALAAQRIISGHLTLIGPLAGTIRFFTGPLIYYVAAFWYSITHGHPWAVSLIIASIFLGSSVLLWLVLSRLTSRLVATLFLGIYAFSAQIVRLERVGWDPNFSFLSGALVLTGLLFPAGGLSYFLGFLGMWLSYQAHFSCFVLAVGVLVLCLWLRRWRFLIFSLAGLAVSLLPTFIFDLRHDFLNARGLLAMMTNPEKISSGFRLSSRFFNLILVSLENLTKLTIPTLPQWSLIGFGGLLLVVWWISKSKNFDLTQKIILTTWIFIFPLVMMFYRGSKPEYYFLMQMPAHAFILVDLVLNLKKFKFLLPSALIGLFLISLGIIISDAQALAAGPSLANKLKALEFIKQNKAATPVQLVLDMEVKDRFGWDYLSNYFELPRSPNGSAVHLIYPVKSGAILTARFGGVGVWFDRRNQENTQAFVDGVQGILFYYPQNYWQLGELERVLFPGDKTTAISGFAPQNLSGKSAIEASILYLQLPKDERHKYFAVKLQAEKPGQLDRWQSIEFLNRDLSSRKTLARERKENLFIFSFPPAFSWEEIELFLSKVEGF